LICLLLVQEIDKGLHKANIPPFRVPNDYMTLLYAYIEEDMVISA